MTRRFVLDRVVDSTGVSGLGRVAEGVEFTGGKCVMCWLTAVSSIAVYDNIAAIEAIHGHQGDTKIVWQDS